MLPPELDKLRQYLKGTVDGNRIDKGALLKELQELGDIPSLCNESLALSSDRCPTCGRAF